MPLGLSLHYVIHWPTLRGGAETGAQRERSHYRACGRVEVGSDRLPTYAHNVPCAIATSVAGGCFTRSCFGEFALVRGGTGGTQSADGKGMAE